MPTITLQISLREDGQELPGFPLNQTLSPTEFKGKMTITRPDAAATFTELPLQDIDTLRLLYVRADQDTTLRFNDQSDAGIPMTANSVLLLFDCNIPNTATSKAAMENASGSNTEAVIVAGGV